ncbi:hypothetical protein CDIMF43_110039 [Carnobacterium divergens]|nr:hypothetical protein CDIMF43_110039 [Carnobacterium divergens]
MRAHPRKRPAIYTIAGLFIFKLKRFTFKFHFFAINVIN